MLNGEKPEAPPLRSGARQGCPTHRCFTTSCWKSLLVYGKKRKGIWFRTEELKLSLFADEMIVYVENPKESGLETFRVGEHIHVPGRCAPQPYGDRRSRLGILPTSPYESLHLAVQAYPWSFPLMNWKMSLVLHHRDTDYYQFHMCPEDSENVDFKT